MKQLNDDQRRLVEEHLALARGITDYVNHTNLDRDDLYQSAYYGLCLAARGYRAENGAAFPTYAHWYVIGCVMGMIKTLRGTEECSVDDFEGESGDGMYGGVVEPAYCPFEGMDDVWYVGELVERLPEWEGEVVSDLYGLGGRSMLDVGEVAKKLGVTVKCVYEYMVRITEDIRELAGNEGI